MPRATEHIGEIIAINAGADRQGVRLRVGGRRLLRRRQGARIRQAQPPRPRRAAGRGADRALGAEAASRRLRALEALEAGRAVVGEPLGPGPARLAHRVLGHEHEVPGPALRHPRRRPRPGLPPPRERAGPVRVVFSGEPFASYWLHNGLLDQGRQEDLQVRPRHDRADERPAQGPLAGHPPRPLAVQPLSPPDRLRPDRLDEIERGLADVLPGVRAVRAS